MTPNIEALAIELQIGIRLANRIQMKIIEARINQACIEHDSITMEENYNKYLKAHDKRFEELTRQLEEIK